MGMTRSSGQPVRAQQHDQAEHGHELVNLAEEHDVPLYFEAAAVIVSLTLLGQMLELRARSQTSAAIKSLLGLAPKTARRIRPDGTEEDVPLTHVHVGDLLRVRPGETVALVGPSGAGHALDGADKAVIGRVIAPVLHHAAGMADSGAIPTEGAGHLLHAQGQRDVADIHGNLADMAERPATVAAWSVARRRLPGGERCAEPTSAGSDPMLA